MSRTKRKLYSGSKRFDHSCRNHGGCGYCENTRTFFDRKRRTAADRDLEFWKKSHRDDLYLGHAGG